MRSLSTILTLSTVLLAAAPALAAGTCTDAEGFCPFRDRAAAAGENCLAMTEDGEKAGCCGAEQGKGPGCCAGKADGAGCCGGETAEGAGCKGEQPEGGAAPHVHPGA